MIKINNSNNKALGVFLLLFVGSLGAVPPEQNKQLDRAILSDDVEKVKELLNQGVDPNYAEGSPEHPGYFEPALITALKDIRKPNENIIKALLEHGANPNVSADEGRTPLFYLLFMNGKRMGRVAQINTARELIRHGVTLVTKDGKAILSNDPDLRITIVGISSRDVDKIMPLVVKSRKQVGHDISKKIAPNLVQVVANEKVEKLLAGKKLDQQQMQGLRKFVEQAIIDTIKKEELLLK